MTQQIIRLHAQTLNEPEQRDLQSKQTGLSEQSVIQPQHTNPIDHTTPINPEQHIPQRTPQQTIQTPTHLIQSVPEHRKRLPQPTTHTHPLRTLTRKQKRQTAIPSNTLNHTPTRTTTNQNTKTLQQPPTIPTQHHSTTLKHRTPSQRQPHIQHTNIPTTSNTNSGSAHKPTQTLHLTNQSTLTPTRQNPRHHTQNNTTTNTHPTTNTITINHTPHNRRLLNNHMSISPTNPKRRHTRTPQTPNRLPRALLAQQLHSTRGPINLRRRTIGMQSPGQHTVAHRHHHLDHTGHPGRRLGMTDIRLHRPQPQRTVLWTFLPIGGQQRLRLNRITKRGARTVSLHHIDIPRPQSRIRQSPQNHALLRGPTGSGQTIARTILIHSATTHNPQHRMPIAPSIRQTLNQQHPHTLTPTSPISIIRKRLTPPINSQTTLTRELDKHIRRGKHRHATNQRQ